MSIQSSVFENGEWVTRATTTDELIRRNGYAHRIGIGRQPRAEPPICGLLTRTVVDSPVTRWILPARLRSSRFNDVVFIGVSYSFNCKLRATACDFANPANQTLKEDAPRKIMSRYTNWVVSTSNCVTLSGNATSPPKFEMLPLSDPRAAIQAVRVWAAEFM